MAETDRSGSSRLFFFLKFLRSPSQVGSVIPTARATIRRLLDPVTWDGVRCAVEYGPGTGVFTRAILERLPADATVLAIDTDAEFIERLRSTITDTRLICVEGSAADVEAILARHGLPRADYVVSGLPFSTLPKGLDDQIMAATARSIQPGGQFLVYQYSDYVLPLLRRHFASVTSLRSWLCIPPAKLFWAKTASVAALPAEVQPPCDGVIENAHHLIGKPPAKRR